MSGSLSTEFFALCQRLEQLRKHFLPEKFDSTGSYTAAQFDQVRAYVALVHAEIEAYIETRCLAVAGRCCDAWKINRTPGRVVFSLHCICYSGWDGVLESHQFKKLVFDKNVESRLVSALEQYTQAVNGNNGIKEQDLKKLLVPLSIRMSDFNPDWLSAMSSFGAVRGQIAHQSSVGLQVQPDPKALRNTVWKELVPGLRSLDMVLTALS